MATICIGDLASGESREIVIEELPVNAGKLVSEHLVMKVRVKGINTLKVRLWLARRIIKLAAKVSGCGIEIEG